MWSDAKLGHLDQKNKTIAKDRIKKVIILSRSPGPLVPWSRSFGALVCWCPGPLVPLSFGAPVLWLVVHWSKACGL